MHRVSILTMFEVNAMSNYELGYLHEDSVIVYHRFALWVVEVLMFMGRVTVTV